jgi:hypothetical protein
MHRWRVDVRFAPMESWSCLMPATFGKPRMHARREGGVVSNRARRDGDRSKRRHPSTDALGCALHDPDGVHRSPRVDVLSVCGCGRSRTRTAACQELARTGANRVDRATQAGHADFADLGLRDAVEHLFTLSRSLGVKWSQVQILSARQKFLQVRSGFWEIGSRFFHTRRGVWMATRRNSRVDGNGTRFTARALRSTCRQPPAPRRRWCGWRFNEPTA